MKFKTGDVLIIKPNTAISEEHWGKQVRFCYYETHNDRGFNNR